MGMSDYFDDDEVDVIDPDCFVSETCVLYMPGLDLKLMQIVDAAQSGSAISREILSRVYPDGYDFAARHHIVRHIMKPLPRFDDGADRWRYAEYRVKGYCVLCQATAYRRRDSRLIHWFYKASCVHCWEWLPLDYDVRGAAGADEFLSQFPYRCSDDAHLAIWGDAPLIHPHCVGRCGYEIGQQALF